MAPARSAVNGKPRRIGIFGGTFNPVHHGHLRAAAAALGQLRLDEVIFLPCARPALKGAGDLMPSRLRLRLLRLAIRGRKKFKVDDQEIRRGGKSYTIDTLRAYKKKWGSRAELFFLLGPDAARSLPEWKESRLLADYAQFRVLRRPEANGRQKRLPINLMERFQLKPVKTPLIPVSSSLVRKMLDNGSSINGMVPTNIGRILTSGRK